MSIKESALTAITSITNSDLIRAVTSAGASRRITVANLAKHFIENYAGSTIGGSAQSVKAAIDSLNSKMTLSGESASVAIGSITSNAVFQKSGGFCSMNLSIGNATALSDFTSGMTIGTAPIGYRPNAEKYAVVAARSIGGWATANYMPMYMSVNSSGDIKLYGNTSDIKTMQYINGQITYVLS